MNPVSPDGNIIRMTLTDAKHLNSTGQLNPEVNTDGKDFSSIIAGAFDRVSDRQMAADNIFERMITHPDEVEIHDVTTAMATAEMSVRLTKAIVDRAVKAYNDITSMR